MPAFLPFVTTLVTLAAAPQGADTDWLRSWARVDQQRPQELSWRGRIAPADEPGTPMVIHGRVIEEDGKTPASSVIVFAYHTDRTGLYDRRDAGPHSWRLRGWARTDAEGRFEFATIRPGAYPSGGVPAHVHFTLVSSDGTRYNGQDLHPDEIQARREGGADHVEHQLRIEPARKF
jgi:protocatechuate 3,4-dioxygenase beta subunit